ncbi:MAG: PQQ-binding-like beta-propeller repeat protein, partial [Phycisphaeraceae bacterium]|nr:PQQ-binding-like beta-propeller repeat protein [Phycisphaeraceae bacterium]
MKSTPVHTAVTPDNRPWYLCAMACVGIGAVFSAVFIMGLIHFSVIQNRVIDQYEADMLVLEEEMQASPSDPKVLQRLRDLDVQIRFLWFHRIKKTSVCALMLLASMIVLVGAVKWTYVLRPERPCPVPRVNATQQFVAHSRFGRLAVGGVAVGFVVFFAIMAVQGQRLLTPEPKNIESSVAQQTTAALPHSAVATDEDLSRNWYRFRGKDGAGVVHTSDIPTEWNGPEGTGIAWKVPLPGDGHNSPITWGNQLFLSGTHEGRQEVYCFDAADGKLLWTGEIPLNPDANDLEVMEDTGLAACTMATDGHRVYAVFASGDLGCFDFDGKKLWHKALGLPDSSYGYASSLDVYRNRVIVQFDQGGDDDELSRLLAIDGATGKVIHDKVRPVANVWTSPMVTSINDVNQVIVVSDPWTMAYDANSFEELWRAECVGGDLAASPIYAGGFVFAIEPYSQLVAIKPEGRGNVTDTHIAWVWEEGGPDIASPVSNGQWICLLDTGGEAFFVNVKDGASGPIHDFEGMFQASPSLVGDVLYVLDEDGVMTLARVSEAMEVEVLRTNPLGEKCLATPAFAEGRIYIRGMEHLWCIDSKMQAPSVLSVATDEDLAKHWYRFRGKDGAGKVHVSDIPTKWNGPEGAGIKWKVPIPGEGNNSPITWGDRLFLSGMSEDKQQVYCFDVAKGDLLWVGDVPQNPEAADLDVMEDTGMAACTMATDGHHVYAIFASGDIGCFDFSGKKLWHKALGVPDSSYGYASSLDVYRNRVIVQFDHGGDDDELSRLLAIDGATGKIIHDKVRPVANV